MRRLEERAGELAKSSTPSMKRSPGSGAFGKRLSRGGWKPNTGRPWQRNACYGPTGTKRSSASVLRPSRTGPPASRPNPKRRRKP